ncbi:MAG: hypothetical protein IKW13_04825 [Thermoguttaceae bacterium]|nr:hypothetical protein [Thermoguttaceae bacterium]
MALEKTRIRLPLPGEMFDIAKSLLSTPDKALFDAAWGENKTDDEIVETFGVDAGARVRELERGLLKLFNFNIGRAAWIEFIDKYRAETDAMKTALAELVAENEKNGAAPAAQTNERSENDEI